MHDEPALTTISAGDAMLLALVNAGTVDAETAVRLGLSVGQVRLRIDRLMALAHVSERSALRAWDPSTPASFTPSLPQPATTGSAAPAASPARRAWLPALVSVVLAAVLVAGLAWWITSGEDAGPLPLAPAAQPPVVTTAATAQPARGTASRPVTVSVEPAVPLPAGLIIYLLTGCGRCVEPPEALERVYRDASGNVTADVLFRAPPGGYIISAWAAGDASDIVIAVCAQGACGHAFSGPIDGEAETALFRSTDGGLSWAVADTFPGGAEVLGAHRSGEVLIRQRLASGAEQFVLKPSGVVLTPPPNALPGRGPQFAGPQGDVVWTTSGLSIISGTSGEAMVPALTPEMWGLSRAATRPGRDDPWAFSWYAQSGRPGEPDVETRVAETDAQGRAFTVVNHLGAPLLIGPWVDTHTLLATLERTPNLAVFPGDPAATVTRVPALLNLDEATLTPIGDPFALPPYAGGRTELLAARLGFFVRISGDTCATILTSPGLGGRPVDCLAPGLIATVTEANVINTVYWVRVRTPAGDLGWLPARVPGVEVLAR